MDGITTRCLILTIGFTGKRMMEFLDTILLMAMQVVFILTHLEQILPKIYYNKYVCNL